MPWLLPSWQLLSEMKCYGVVFVWLHQCSGSQPHMSKCSMDKPVFVLVQKIYISMLSLANYLFPDCLVGWFEISPTRLAHFTTVKHSLNLTLQGVGNGTWTQLHASLGNCMFFHVTSILNKRQLLGNTRLKLNHQSPYVISNHDNQLEWILLNLCKNLYVLHCVYLQYSTTYRSMN